MGLASRTTDDLGMHVAQAAPTDAPVGVDKGGDPAVVADRATPDAEPHLTGPPRPRGRQVAGAAGGRRRKAAPMALSPVTLVCQLGAFSTWKRIAAIKLPFPTYHVQGLVKLHERYFLSAVDQDAEQGFLIAFQVPPKRGGGVAQEIGRTVLKDGPRYHPGGMDVDRHTGRIWLPLAEYRADSTASIYAVDPTTLQAHKIADVDDHIGAIADDAEQKLLHLIAWGRKVYSMPVAADGTLPPAGAAWKPFTPPDSVAYGPFKYQDCKYVAPGYVLAGGQDGLLWKAGVLDVLHFRDADTHSPSAVPYEVVHRIDVPRVRHDGRSAFPLECLDTLTQNAMTYVILQDRQGKPLMRLYFVPHDGPESHLLIYDAYPRADAPRWPPDEGPWSGETSTGGS